MIELEELSMDPIIELGVTPKRFADYIFDKYYPNVAVIIVDTFETEIMAYYKIKEKIEEIVDKLIDREIEEIEEVLRELGTKKIIRLYSERLEDLEMYLIFFYDP